MSTRSLPQRITAELLGTCLFVAAVIGSGVMSERLAGGNIALALLANTIATGAVLIALMLAFGGISGAHLNPAVTVSSALVRGISRREAALYIIAQCFGGLAGAAIAHLMFGLPLFSLSIHARSGSAQGFSEFVATFGLLAVIWGCSRARPASVPFAVGAYITAAYWFTSSTSFANPAVTIARAVSDTFPGISPVDVPLFMGAQLGGAISATLLFRWLVPSLPKTGKDVLLPRPSNRPVKTYLLARVQNAGRSQMAAALSNLYPDRKHGFGFQPEPNLTGWRLGLSPLDKGNRLLTR